MSTNGSVFDRAKGLFLHYAKPLKLDERHPGTKILERLTTPDKIMAFRLSLQMDDGSVQVFPAYRVQFNDDLGPYKGGLRFHPQVTLEEVKALAFWMYLKTAVVNIPFGGGKGGITVDYKSLSTAEKERLTKKFAIVLANDIGENTDIPAPDVNTGPQEMAWMSHAWRMSTGQYNRAMITGKPLDLGGSLGRTEATGHGCAITMLEAARDAGIDPNGATMVIQGFGNAGRYAAIEMGHQGTKTIVASDSRAAVHNPDGLDVQALIEHKDKTGSVANFPGGKTMDPNGVLTAECDFLVPAALEDCITAEIAPKIQAKIIGEAANGPTTQDAIHILYERGITVIPDVLANSGGVTVSYFEWVQNRQEYYWTREEVIDRMRARLVNAYREIADRAKAEDTSLRQAAYENAIERVVRAALERGAQ
ncbi:MAG: Glu/Leu/Phe/Val dehydrogenase [Pirellulales bacterium]|nr:Glu/Leu/Phe/Val dehydrogenase [Pirellulales bacterium]